MRFNIRYPLFEGEAGNGGGNGGGGQSFLDRADTSQQQQQTQTPPDTSGQTAQRPDYIPEKFWDKEKGQPDVGKMGAAYISLEKMMGQKRELKHPGDTADAAQIDAYMKELRKVTGAPEKAEEYGLKAPDNLPEGIQWNQEYANAAASWAHKHAISPKALHELLDLHNNQVQTTLETSKKDQEAAITKLQDDFRKEWGADYNNNIQRAIRGGTALLGGKDPRGFPELANHPEFLRAALNFDKQIREDAGLVQGASDKETYQEQMDRIQKSDDLAGKNGTERQKAALDKLKGLHAAMASK